MYRLSVRDVVKIESEFFENMFFDADRPNSMIMNPQINSVIQLKDNFNLKLSQISIPESPGKGDLQINGSEVGEILFIDFKSADSFIYSRKFYSGEQNNLENIVENCIKYCFEVKEKNINENSKFIYVLETPMTVPLDEIVTLQNELKTYFDENAVIQIKILNPYESVSQMTINKEIINQNTDFDEKLENNAILILNKLKNEYANYVPEAGKLINLRNLNEKIQQISNPFEID